MTREFNNAASFDQDDERKWKLVAIMSMIFFGSVFVAFLVIYKGSLKKVQLEDVLGIAATLVVLILASTYFYASRFYKDIFYLFVSIGWFFNALYIPSELLFSGDLKESYDYSISVFYLSTASDIVFFCSTLVSNSNPPFRRSRRTTVLIVILWVLISLLPSIYFLGTRVHQSETPFMFLSTTVIGTLFSIYVLVGVGMSIKERMDREMHGKLRTILPLTFYLYAVLQPLYPVRFYLPIWALLTVFGAACLIKLANNVALLSVLLSVKYPEIQEAKKRLEMRSKLEELGAIAASIEHDLKTPLAAMNLALKTMRDRFQANDEVVKGLARIEDTKNRITAIAKVIPYMTGGQEFYDRESYMLKTPVMPMVHRAIKLVKEEVQIDPNKFFFDVSRKDGSIRAYPPMIEQVLVNVLKNGIEAIHEKRRDRGLIQINVRSVNTPKDDKFSKWIKVDITDNGRGISDENIPLATTLFTDRAERKPNSGIGLFVGNKLMRIHDGKIQIQSELDKGTTVSLWFPEWESYVKWLESQKEHASDSAKGEQPSMDAIATVSSKEKSE